MQQKNSMLKTSILKIENLQAMIAEKTILNGLNIHLRAGEIHAIMGPNGSGKSTLANLLARKPGITVSEGHINYLETDLLTLTPEECAWKGIFLGFQYPVSIPGVTNIQFLKFALNAHRSIKGLPPLDAIDFLALVKEKMAELEMPEELLYRSVNDGFSGGGEKTK